MVDEAIFTVVQRQRESLLNTSSGLYTDFDEMYVNLKADLPNHSFYDTSTSSPESLNENSFTFNEIKLHSNTEKNTEKKIHWNLTQVLSLLDCIEKRASDFKKKSVQKSVWLSIGKEMLEHGDFSMEHCYNKWKNLRRDVRLFKNSNSMQKMSIRNTCIMERVQKMVNDMGCENSYRKSWSTNIDVGNQNEITNVIESQILDLKQIDEIKPEIVDRDLRELFKVDQNVVETKFYTNASIEDSFVSLLSNPSVAQVILTNPKLFEDILSGIDVSKQNENSHSNRIYSTQNDVSQMTTNKNIEKIPINNNNTDNIAQNFALNGQNLSPNFEISDHGWPHQLYELLHSFRDEEDRQIQRLDQIVNNVQVMQNSTKRRLITLNQLLSLARMLIR